MKKLITLFSLILISTSSLQAAEPELVFMSIRDRGMGGAGIALASGDGALYKNPAGLAESDFHVKMPRIGTMVSQEWQDKYEDFSKLSGDEGTENDQLLILKDLVPLKVGTVIHANPILSLTWPGFGIGAYGSGQFVGRLKRKTSPTLEVSGHGDVVPMVGYAQKVEMFGINPAVGVSLKFINRVMVYDKASGESSFSLSQTEMLDYINDSASKKEAGTMTLTGVGFDVGMISGIDSSFLGKGQWGLVFNNIGASVSGERDRQANANAVVTKEDVSKTIPMTAKIGAAFQSNILKGIPLLGSIGEFTLATDYKFISPHSSIYKNIHLGVEKPVLFDIVKLRGGINQGFVVGGVGIDLSLFFVPVLHINYAYTVEELGQEVDDDPIKYHSFEVGILF
jgi:hypothetical protein